MALTAGTVYEVRDTATTGNVNGAGFNPANANFVTDLVAADGDTSTPDVSSATYTFGAGDVNSYLYISAGTNWVVGWYPISAVNAGVATLDASVGAVVLSIGTQGIVTRNTSVGCATTASPTGGSFSIDYTQQDTATLTGTDLTCTAGSTTVNSATGGFTPAMKGNLVHLTALTGTGAITGWYECVQWTDTNNIVLDRTPTDGANDITAGTFYLGGAGRFNALFDVYKISLPAASMTFIKKGTYQPGASATSPSTTSKNVSPSFLIGYTSIRGDVCNGTDRPTIDMQSYGLTWCAYQYTKNINYLTTQSSGINNTASTNRHFNCKVLNSSTTANRQGFGTGRYFECEAVSQNGYAINGGGTGAILIGCYLHDSSKGLTTTNTIVAVGNIVAFCTTAGLETSITNGSQDFINNTIYGRAAQMGTGINLNNDTLSQNNRVVNNIITGCATGVSAVTLADSNFSHYNNFYNNTANGNNWTIGQEDVSINPSFTNVVERTGTTATTSGSVLTDTSKDFTAADLVTDNVDYLHTVSGTGVTVACFLITSHDATTITVNNALGTSTAGDVVYWISHGHNFTPSSAMVGIGAPNFTKSTGGLSTGYPTIGAVVPQTTGGGGGSYVF